MPRREREPASLNAGLRITAEPVAGWGDGGPPGPRALGVTDPDRLGLLLDDQGRTVRDADGSYETLHSLKLRGRRALRN